VGRRAKHSKEEFQRIALAAAQAVIEEQGLRGLNVRSVAARMGVSVGTIYNIFTGLEELVALVNGETLDALHDALAKTPLTGRPERDLHALLDRYLDFVAAQESSWNLLFEEHLPGAGEAPAWYRDKISRLFDLLAGILKPLFPDDSRDEVAGAVRLLWIALHGVWSLNAREHLSLVTDVPLHSVAHDMVDVFLAGLARRAVNG
jgi:AcrR family transcriptional regulator